jgi:hypothetical protein
MKKIKPTQGVMINVQRDVNKFIESQRGFINTDYYEATYSNIRARIEQLASIEEGILQRRCLLTKPLDIKLSFMREYVYARCPFYRRDKGTKDIRVLVSRINLIDPTNPKPSLNDLYLNTELMDKAKDKLIQAMTEIVLSR